MKNIFLLLIYFLNSNWFYISQLLRGKMTQREKEENPKRAQMKSKKKEFKEMKIRKKKEETRR